MGLLARAVTTRTVNSTEAGTELAQQVLRGFDGHELSVIVAYSTINHDQGALLRGLREVVGPNVAVIGCSSQGVMARGHVEEEGYAAGVMGLGGRTLTATTAYVENIEHHSRDKGAALGRGLKSELADPPKVVVLLYDPLCGADMDCLLAGLFEEVRCPIIGGGAAQAYGPMIQTFQYFGARAFSHGAVAVALAGDFTAELATCHGTSPVGIEMNVTKADGTCLLELDGRPALDVWQEITRAGLPSVEHTAGLAIGISPPGRVENGPYLVRAAFGVDTERRGVVLQTGLTSGTKIMLHHRTVQGVLDGTAEMARELRLRLNGRKVHAVLGFECAARTEPYLGREDTQRENVALQEAVAAEAEWLGLLAYGELFPIGGQPTFQNYTYPVLVLAD